MSIQGCTATVGGKLSTLTPQPCPVKVWVSSAVLGSGAALMPVFPVGKNNIAGRWEEGEQGLSVYSVALAYGDVDIYWK